MHYFCAITNWRSSTATIENRYVVYAGPHDWILAKELKRKDNDNIIRCKEYAGSIKMLLEYISRNLGNKRDILKAQTTVLGELYKRTGIKPTNILLDGTADEKIGKSIDILYGTSFHFCKNHPPDILERVLKING